jgi:hypothetical protein
MSCNGISRGGDVAKRSKLEYHDVENLVRLNEDFIYLQNQEFKVKIIGKAKIFPYGEVKITKCAEKSEYYGQVCFRRVHSV